MYLQMWMLFVVALSLADNTHGIIPDDSTNLNEPDSPSRQNDKFSTSHYPYIRSNGNNLRDDYPDERASDFSRRCSERLENALEELRRRQLAKQRSFQLNGYSLHQEMRAAPYDMYVTDMRVRMPTSIPWVRVDRCHFNPTNTSLETSLLFSDLTISGKVNLFNENELRNRGDLRRDAGDVKRDPSDLRRNPGDLRRDPNDLRRDPNDLRRDPDDLRRDPNDLRRDPLDYSNEEGCNMILRLRRAGIGFYTEPIRRERGQFNVRTDSHFLEPGFISVYAYGCAPKLRSHRRDFNEEEDEILSREMEDIFLKGIRSLLTTYMQKQLQPAIKETLMTNMGYTLSYG